MKSLVGATKTRAFITPELLCALAKEKRRPLWGSATAAGGFANHHKALAVDAKGKVRWKSSFDFNYSVKLQRLAGHPLTHPDDMGTAATAERASKGYGRIGRELEPDFFQLVSIERGHPLRQAAFLKIKADTRPAQIERWRATPRAIKPLAPVKRADEKYWVFGNRENGFMTTGLKGEACATLSEIFQRGAFRRFVIQVLEVPVNVVSRLRGEVLEARTQKTESIEVQRDVATQLPAPELKVDRDPLPPFPRDALKSLRSMMTSVDGAKTRRDARRDREDGRCNA